MNQKFLAGWSEADITPTDGKRIPLYGQYYQRIARGIHSRLKTVALAIESDGEQALMASLDLVGFQEYFQDMVRDAVAALEPAIDRNKIFLNAIHTHNGPSVNRTGLSVVGRDDYQDADVLTPEEYIAFCVPAVAGNLVRAWRNRQPSGIVRAFGSARIGHCRRAVYRDGTAEMYGDTTREDFIGMEAGEDSGVEMLFTVDPAGRKTGMLLNVACPSQVMESTYLVSSDFAGTARELLKEAYGSEFHTLYQISPAGCQSPRDLVRHYAGSEPDCWHADGVDFLAKRLLEAVRGARETAADYRPAVRHLTRRITLPRRRASYPMYVAAQAEIRRLEGILPVDPAFAAFCEETHANEKLDGHGPYDSKLHHFVRIKNAQAVVERYAVQDAEPTMSFNLNAVRLGDAAVVNNPFELYLTFGQIIKARSRAVQTFLVQLSAGADHPAGYLPSPEAERFGGYGGLIINGQVGSDGGYLLADETVKIIGELFD